MGGGEEIWGGFVGGKRGGNKGCHPNNDSEACHPERSEGVASSRCHGAVLTFPSFERSHCERREAILLSPAVDPGEDWFGRFTPSHDPDICHPERSEGSQTQGVLGVLLHRNRGSIGELPALPTLTTSLRVCLRPTCRARLRLPNRDIWLPTHSKMVDCHGLLISCCFDGVQESGFPGEKPVEHSMLNACDWTDHDPVVGRIFPHLVRPGHRSSPTEYSLGLALTVTD
jgi:hypothetical protein